MSQKFCDHTILTGVLLPIRQHGLSKSFITFSLLQQCGLHSRRSSFQGPSGGEATRNQDRLPCSPQPHRHNAVKRSGPQVAYTEYHLGIGTKGTDRAGSCGSVMERWSSSPRSRDFRIALCFASPSQRLYDSHPHELEKCRARAATRPSPSGPTPTAATTMPSLVPRASE